MVKRSPSLLSKSKVDLYSKRLECLSHIIDDQGIHADADKMQCIHECVGDPSKIRPYSSLTGLLLSLFSLTAFSFRKPKNKRKAE